MRRWQVRLGAALLLLAGMAGPGEAGDATLARVFTPGCTVAFTSAAFADAGTGTGADGRTRGFVEANGDGCHPDERVWYVEGEGLSWDRPEVTPYRGVVLAAAGGLDSTWLLYQGLTGVFLGKRTGPGVYTHPQLLSSFTGPQPVLPGGDLVVSGGRWWAVWSEAVRPEQAGPASAAGARPRTRLFEAGTLAGAPVTRRPLTVDAPGAPAADPAADEVEPALAFEPGRGELTLAWVRKTPGALISDLYLGRTRPGEPWVSRVVSRPGTLNLGPALATGPVGEGGEGVTLAWRQDLRVMAATAGSAPVAVSSGPGLRPQVAVVDGRVRVGWTEPGRRGRAVVAERWGKVWAEREVNTGLTADQSLVGMGGAQEKVGTVLVLTERGELFAASLAS